MNQPDPYSQDPFVYCVGCGNTDPGWAHSVEYTYDHPERYDGVSEWQCWVCGVRTGRWSRKALAEGECEKRFAPLTLEPAPYTLDNRSSTMKDFLGNEIKPGDIVVYPTRQSSRMWMNRAKVTQVRSDGTLRVQRADGTVKPIVRVDRVVVVTKQVEEALHCPATTTTAPPAESPQK